MEDLPPKILITEAEAAELLSVSRQFLRKSRTDGNRRGRADGPPFVKKGRMVRYLVSDLDAWIAKDRKQPGQ